MVVMLYKIFAEFTWILIGFLLGGMLRFAKSGGGMRAEIAQMVDIIIYGSICAILNGIVAATLLSSGFETRVPIMVGLDGTIALLMFFYIKNAASMRKRKKG
tara:strand:- start:226 stop:531 length:306 start_codon:yes stop_codon:yes gene_type:complete